MAGPEVGLADVSHEREQEQRGCRWWAVVVGPVRRLSDRHDRAGYVPNGLVGMGWLAR